jgi:hypothetical protein
MSPFDRGRRVTESDNIAIGIRFGFRIATIM